MLICLSAARCAGLLSLPCSASVIQLQKSYQRPGVCHNTGHDSRHVHLHRAARHALIQLVTIDQKVQIGGTRFTCLALLIMNHSLLCETASLTLQISLPVQAQAATKYTGD